MADQLDAREAAVYLREQNAAAREAALDAREAAVTAREVALDGSSEPALAVPESVTEVPVQQDGAIAQALAPTEEVATPVGEPIAPIEKDNSASAEAERSIEETADSQTEKAPEVSAEVFPVSSDGTTQAQPAENTPIKEELPQDSVAEASDPIEESTQGEAESAPVEQIENIEELSPVVADKTPAPIDLVSRGIEEPAFTSTEESAPIDVSNDIEVPTQNPVETDAKAFEEPSTAVEESQPPVETETKAFEDPSTTVEESQPTLETETKPLEEPSATVEESQPPVETESKPIEGLSAPVEEAQIPVDLSTGPIEESNHVIADETISQAPAEEEFVKVEAPATTEAEAVEPTEKATEVPDKTKEEAKEAEPPAPIEGKTPSVTADNPVEEIKNVVKAGLGKLFSH